MAPKPVAGSKNKASVIGGEPPAKRARAEKKSAPLSNRRIAPTAAAIAAKKRQRRPAAAAAAAGAGAGAEYVPTAPLPPLATSLHNAMLDRVAFQATIAAAAKAVAVQAMLELGLQAIDDKNDDEDVPLPESPLPESPKRLSPELEQLEKNGRIAFILESKNGPINIGYHEMFRYEQTIYAGHGKPEEIRKGWKLACDVNSYANWQADFYVKKTIVFYGTEKFEIPENFTDDVVYVMNANRDPHKESTILLLKIAAYGLRHDGLKLESDGLTRDKFFLNYTRVLGVEADYVNGMKFDQLIDQWRAEGDVRIAPPSVGEYDRGFPVVAT